jgi:hypothetical protein
MDYFGKKKDQDLKSFADELKALSDMQLANLRRMLEARGYKFAG